MAILDERLSLRLSLWDSLFDLSCGSQIYLGLQRLRVLEKGFILYRLA